MGDALDVEAVLAKAMSVAGRGSFWTARELLDHDFPEPRFAVPGVIAEGLNLLAGAPKLGKSWFAMNIAAAVAYGGLALDRVKVEPGEVLYLALEDPPRRLKSRLSIVLGGEAAPEGLVFASTWPLLLEGGNEQLDEWLAEHPACRLVVVDVFAKVRGVTNGNGSRYELDYAAMSMLKTIADRHTVAILVIHHTRKMAGNDFVDEVSGTHGLAGAADAVLVLSRSRGSADAVLKITGRDVEEAERAMRFDAVRGSWALLDGPADEYDLGDTRRAVLRHLRDAGPAKPKAIADALKLDHELVKKTAQRMVGDEQIGKDSNGTYYSLDTPSLLSPLSPDTDEQGRQGREGHGFRPLVGTPGYAIYIDSAYAAGHLTATELRDQLELDRFVRRGHTDTEIAA